MPGISAIAGATYISAKDDQEIPCLVYQHCWCMLLTLVLKMIKKYHAWCISIAGATYISAEADQEEIPRLVYMSILLARYLFGSIFSMLITEQFN